jgi:hypothetical protein
MLTTTLSPDPSDDEDDNASTTSGESDETDMSSVCSTSSSPKPDNTLYSGTYSQPRVGFNNFESYMKHSSDFSAPEYTGPPGKTLSSVKSPSSTEAPPTLTLSVPYDTKTFRWEAGISYFLPEGAETIRNFVSQMGVGPNQSERDAGLTLSEVEGGESAYDLAVDGSRQLNDLHRQLVSAIHHTDMTQDEGYGLLQSLIPKIQGEGTVTDHQKEFQEVKSELARSIDDAWKKTYEARPATVYHKYMPDSWVEESLVRSTLKPENDPDWLFPGLYHSSSLVPGAEGRPDSGPRSIVWTPEALRELHSCYASLPTDALYERGPEDRQYTWDAGASLHPDPSDPSRISRLDSHMRIDVCDKDRADGFGWRSISPFTLNSVNGWSDTLRYCCESLADSVNLCPDKKLCAEAVDSFQASVDNLPKRATACDYMRRVCDLEVQFEALKAQIDAKIPKEIISKLCSEAMDGVPPREVWNKSSRGSLLDNK